MIGQSGIGVGGELGDQGGILLRRDGGRRTGGVARGEIPCRAPLMQIALDGTQADREATRDGRLALPLHFDGVDDALAEIRRICFHPPSKPPRQSFCKPL